MSQCLVSVTCSDFLNSCSVPGLHSLRGLDFQPLLLNAKSINNKAPIIQGLIEEEHANVACITEIWQSPDVGVLLTADSTSPPCSLLSTHPYCYHIDVFLLFYFHCLFLLYCFTSVFFNISFHFFVFIVVSQLE